MLYSAAFYIALAVCLLGFAWRVGRWFRIDIGPEAHGYSPARRMAGAVRGLLSLLGPKGLTAAKAVLFDAIGQGPIMKAGPWRWILHFSIFVGFTGLFLMHAMDDQITARLFSDYAPTLNPFLWLRNLFGLMVLFGTAGAAIRAFGTSPKDRRNTMADGTALALLAVLILSGFLLEAAKISSEPAFDRMVEEYTSSLEPEELEGLKDYWAVNYGVVFHGRPVPAHTNFDPAILELNQDNCAYCHSLPSSAFVSYPLSKVVSPLEAGGARPDVALWYIHFLSAFLFLAYLPFGKFRHIFITPISLIIRRIEQRGNLEPVNRATRLGISLDACVNCGECSRRCSVNPSFRVLGNPDILPATKLGSVGGLAQAQSSDLARLNEGRLICTDCYRCTTVCPAGVNLQDLWDASGEDLEARGHSSAYKQAADAREQEKTPARPGYAYEINPDVSGLDIEEYRLAFSCCLQCGTCTGVCPVVAARQIAPGIPGDVTPQQIVNTYRLGITDLVTHSRMVWDCFSCFKCQESCPAGIPVAEMIYALRNRGWQPAAASRDAERGMSA